MWMYETYLLLVSCQPLTKKSRIRIRKSVVRIPRIRIRIKMPRNWLMTIHIQLFHLDADPDSKIFTCRKVKKTFWLLFTECQFPLIHLSCQRHEHHNFSILYISLKISGESIWLKRIRIRLRIVRSSIPTDLDPTILRRGIQREKLSCARFCKHLWSPGIDSEEPTPPSYVACGAGTTKRVVVQVRQAGNQFRGSLKGL